jgi:hypothetical protein
LGISYSSIFAALMAVAGAVLLMVRYKAINLKAAENWEEEYQLSASQGGSPVDQVGEQPDNNLVEEEQLGERVKTQRAKKAVRSQSTLQKKAREKIAARKIAKESSTRTIREKKTS